MFRLLGPLLLKNRRFWGWFVPKNFQWLHFLFSGPVIWWTAFWVICPWNEFEEREQCEWWQAFAGTVVPTAAAAVSVAGLMCALAPQHLGFKRLFWCLDCRWLHQRQKNFDYDAKYINYVPKQSLENTIRFSCCTLVAATECKLRLHASYLMEREKR